MSMLRTITMAAVLTVALPASAAPLRFTLDVSPTKGTLGDSYEAVVQIEVAGLSAPERYSAPDFGEFQVVDSRINQGTSSVVNPAHGQSIRTTIVRRYSLKPRQAGRLSYKELDDDLGFGVRKAG